jgi:hypothetical protein
MPKYYQNSYYKKNLYNYGNSNYNAQARAQLMAQITKTFVAPQTSFFRKDLRIFSYRLCKY